MKKLLSAYNRTYMRFLQVNLSLVDFRKWQWLFQMRCKEEEALTPQGAWFKLLWKTSHAFREILLSIISGVQLLESSRTFFCLFFCVVFFLQMLSTQLKLFVAHLRPRGLRNLLQRELCTRLHYFWISIQREVACCTVVPLGQHRGQVHNWQYLHAKTVHK